MGERETVFTTPSRGYFMKTHKLRLGFNLVSAET